MWLEHEMVVGLGFRVVCGFRGVSPVTHSLILERSRILFVKRLEIRLDSAKDPSTGSL
jgi:hypothetical protein